MAYTVYGTDNDDRLFGNANFDTDMYGYGGNDYIQSYNGNDHIDGGAGNDTIKAGSGRDTIFGGDGDDYIWGGEGRDIIDGGDGFDIVSYLDIGYGSAYGILINNQGPNPAVSSIRNDKTINEHVKYDTLVNIEGFEGTVLQDYFYGGAKDDYFRGDAGDDMISGGAGINQLYGGDGNDQYTFSASGGTDYVYEVENSSIWTGGDQDKCFIANTLSQSDVLFLRYENSLRLQTIDGSTKMIFVDWFTNFEVEQFYFANGNVTYTADDIVALLAENNADEVSLTAIAPADESVVGVVA